MFGDVIDGVMVLNGFGKIVATEWTKTETMRPNVIIDEFIVMPNHMHGIIIIRRGTRRRAPTTEQFGQPTHNSIPSIIRGFKSTVTKQINQWRNTPGMPVWQRNYYEHAVRNDNDLAEIREYIVNNPLQWHLDRENPTNW